MGRTHAAAAILVIALASCNDADRESCGGYCGPDTECIDGKCRAMVEPPAAEPALDDKADGNKRRRRRGRRGDSAPSEGGLPGVPRVDDSHIPKFDRKRTETIDMKGGSERLSDRSANRHLGTLEKPFNDCIAGLANAQDEEVAPGTIRFEIGLEPSGKVWGVTVRAPKHLRPIVPCLRKAVYHSRFPRYDGPAMGVDYSFKVG